MLELLIHKEQNKTVILLVENGILIERHEEYEDKKRLEGNIYSGKVQNVISGMESAFIDVGESRNTFIRLNDLLPKVDQTKLTQVGAISSDIKEIIKPGEYITIQVRKDGTDKKGARVSTHINLPGIYAAFMPNSNFITVSQKIEDEQERQRLIDIAKKVLPKKTGAIIRTSAEKIEDEKLTKELESLITKWEEISKNVPSTPNAPKLVYNNMALLRRTVIDVMGSGLSKITVNDEKMYNDIAEIISGGATSLKNAVKLALKKDEDLLNIYSLKSQIEEAENRKIWLKSGAYITIDRTEALTAIDVNTGKYVGTKNLEETVYIVNKEATEEIARQLRLRDIGGIIIIDYIDMHNKANEQKIVELLKTYLKQDRTNCQVEGFTKLNLLEMTRKNVCNNENY